MNALARIKPYLNGIGELRLMVRNFGNCHESFLMNFSAEELIKIHRAWLASGWDIFPDQWETNQVDDALNGIPPQWDKNEKPIYK